jgi:hypothetical protein
MAYTLNVAVEWIKLLLCFRGRGRGGRQQGSNLDEKTGYPDSSFVVFLALSSKCRDSTSNYGTTASFHILYNSLFPNHPIIRRYTI